MVHQDQVLGLFLDLHLVQVLLLFQLLVLVPAWPGSGSGSGSGSENSNNEGNISSGDRRRRRRHKRRQHRGAKDIDREASNSGSDSIYSKDSALSLNKGSTNSSTNSSVIWDKDSNGGGSGGGVKPSTNSTKNGISLLSKNDKKEPINIATTNSSDKRKIIKRRIIPYSSSSS